MITGISYATNITEIRRLYEKLKKEGNNKKKLKIALEMQSLKITHSAFPEDWESVGETQKRATMDESLLIFRINNQYYCCYFKRDTIIKYDKVGISWNDKNLLDFKILEQTPLRAA